MLKKIYFLKQLFLAITIFSFISYANAAADDTSIGDLTKYVIDDVKSSQHTIGIVDDVKIEHVNSQEVYLAEKPLPTIVAWLKQEGKSDEQVSGYLKSTLPVVTPRLAKDRFNIEWIDNSLLSKDIIDQFLFFMRQELNFESSVEIKKIPYVYPAVAICYIGPEVGYGLFAMENIKKGDIIAEYTGSYVKYAKSAKQSPYIVPNSDYGDDGAAYLDAEHRGNVARFASYLPTEKELSLYKYKLPDDVEVVLANARLVAIGFPPLQLLVATKDIKPYEQIGFSYDLSYGYEFSPWPEEPQLFNKNGEIISRDKYDVSGKMVQIFDEITGKHVFVDSKIIDVIRPMPSVDNYMVLRDDTDAAIINYSVFIQQISKPRNRITIPACFLNYRTQVKKFIKLLKDVDQCALSKEDRIRILDDAKRNKFATHDEIIGTPK